MLWRRLDIPGHDACWLLPEDSGWQLQGAAVFREQGAVAHLMYRLHCDARWLTRTGSVMGRIGDRAVHLDVTAGEAGWRLNGEPVPGLEGCLDLDFGFTPSTNLFQLRRTALQVGQAADVPVAWLDIDSARLQLLQQRYARRSADHYWYEAPRFDYRALLEVDPTGFVRSYPGLWQAED